MSLKQLADWNTNIIMKKATAACGSSSPDEKPNPQPTACGSACGASSK